MIGRGLLSMNEIMWSTNNFIIGHRLVIRPLLEQEVGLECVKCHLSREGRKSCAAKKENNSDITRNNDAQEGQI